jgi:Mn2+/Fe2+ NRAMP family transporter
MPDSHDPNDAHVDAAVPQAKASWWRSLGPGLITGAADDDPSGIATYSQGGAQFGVDVAWTLLITFPLMVGIQLASARIGRVTGKGLTEVFASAWPRAVVIGLVGLLVIANVINLGADLNAMGAATVLVAGGDGRAWALLFMALSLGLQVFLSYERYVRFLKWLTLSLFAYVGVAFSSHVDWPAALLATVWPHLHATRDYVTTVVAILGTTISPYLFFWQAAQEVEEIRRVPADQALRVAPEQARRQLRRLRIDTVVGMAFSNVIAFFMIVATAATLHQHGAHDIQTTQQAAEALRPVAGDLAFFLFAMGIVGTGLLALPVLAGSAAYAIASLVPVRRGLDLPLHRAREFYAILAASMIVGGLIGTARIDPIQALFGAAVINAVIAVPIMVAVMLAACSRKVMGPLALPLRWRIPGWAATGAMGAAALVWFATMVA